MRGANCEKTISKKEVTKRLNMLSLFSGCGGMDIGFEGGFICHRRSIGHTDWVGRSATSDGKWVEVKPTRFETIFANDILPEARTAWLSYMTKRGKGADTYRFGSVVDYVKRHKAGEAVFPTDVDIVTGGFPCQDFSLAGKRLGFESHKDHTGRIHDHDIPSEETRGKLYMWMKQVIEITRPKVFVAENVKGLVNLGDVKSVIQRDFAEAGGNGYLVLPPRVLHAADYGVPEARERVIFIGIRIDALRDEALKALSAGEVAREYDPYPQATHYHKGSGADGLLPAVSCGEVFEGLAEPEDSQDASQRYYSKAKYMGRHCQGQKEVDVDGIAPTIRSEHHGNIEFRRLSAEHGGKHAKELEAGLDERRLTPRECALIQTFPPDYEFVKPKAGSHNRFELNASGAYKVIGNAVPPVLAYHIAKRLEEVWPLYFGE